MTLESIAGDHAVVHIPHGVETGVFSPLDKKQCKTLLGLPENKNVLLCGMETMNRPLKGADLLLEALRGLPDAVKKESVLLFFGHADEEIMRRFEMPVMNLGFLHNASLKAMAFSAADVFVNPTRAENFPLVVLESMACGTPVVSFAVGGVPEMVRPGTTGYLAEPENPDDLRKSVMRFLDDKAGHEAMARKCREIVMAEYPLELQVQRYIDLYQQVINGNS